MFQMILYSLHEENIVVESMVTVWTTGNIKCSWCYCAVNRNIGSFYPYKYCIMLNNIDKAELKHLT
jgi:hypothetical protein